MQNDREVNYDAFCYATFVNIRTLTSGAKQIVFNNFDYANKEHKFVLAVAMACWHILGAREIAFDCDIFTRRRINKKYKHICKIAKPTEEKSVDINSLLDYMRSHACEVMGKDFTFGEIYDAYYAKEEER